MKLLKIVAIAAAIVLLSGTPALADTTSFKGFGGVGAGLTLIGPGIGLGLIGFSALQSMARQPEMAGKLQTGMLIIAALIEGLAFFALIICFLQG